MMCGKKYLIIDGLICAAIYSVVLFLAFYKYDFGNSTFIIVVAVIAGLYFFGLAYKSFMLLADIVTLPRNKIVKFVRIGAQEHLNIFVDKWYFMVCFYDGKSNKEYICVDDILLSRLNNIEQFSVVEIKYYALSRTIVDVKGNSIRLLRENLYDT